MKKLIDICDIQYGYAFDSKCFTEDSSYPPLVRIRDIKRGYSETYYSGDYPEEYTLSAGDLLVGMDGEFNIARWKCSGALLNQRVCKLIAKSGTNEEYLRFAMSKALKEIEQRTAFVTVKHLSAKELSKIELDVPELSKQDRIADTLNRLENVIEARREELDKLDKLIRARFVEMFSGTYEEVLAENVCSEIVDCPHSTPKYDEEKLIYPAIRTSEIQNGTIFWSSMKYVGIVEYEKRTKRLKPAGGDIIYAREGTYGDCVILPNENKFCLGQRTMLFRPDYKICTSAYLHTALRSDSVKKQADESNAGSTVPHVNVADAKKFHFPLPPMELQQQFSDFVRATDKSKAVVQKSLEETQLLFDSLMQKYFGY